MPIFIFIVSIILFLLVAERSVSLLRKYLRSQSEKAVEPQLEKLGLLTILLIILACLLFGFSFFAPFIFTHKAIDPAFDFSETGQIGDTIGGLMNPFITLSGVIVTGLAFYMQYRANHIQRELFDKGQRESNRQFQHQLNLQQFESQFYEMLRLHKENVNELEMTGKKRGSDGWETVTVSKRQVFQQMHLEFEALLDIVSYDHNRALTEMDEPTTNAYSQPLTEKQFKECYRIFFWGFDERESYELPESSIKDFKNITADRFPISIEYETMQAAHLPFVTEAFQGHAAQLGHYFRHLFMMVKFVVNSSIIDSYPGKMRYLKILRAQLSNYEQIMLFYNWVSGYGERWEDDKRHFFTEYTMIHNLWYDELFKNSFITKKIDELRNKVPLLREGKLFEIDDPNKQEQNDPK